jgi:hypothetical protein
MAGTSKPKDLSAAAADTARYARRLAEFGEEMAALPGDEAAKARDLLAGASDAALQAATLMEAAAASGAGTTKGKLRLHVSATGQSAVLTDAAVFLLESNRGDTPVTWHDGASRRQLPYAVRVSSRLVSRLRALLGDDAVWTEGR